jgi:ribosome-binding protein aMBF1 (putative translation factor)
VKKEGMCKLCCRNKAFLIAKIGDALIEVCTFCAIVDKLEIVEAIDVWSKEAKREMEVRNQEKTEL